MTLLAAAWPLPVCFATGTEAAIEDSSGQFVFELLPKSFNKSPRVDMTVITEMTDEGRTIPPASRERPTYYVAQAGGYRVSGIRYGGEKSPAPEDIERRLKKALTTNGYVPATPEHPPTIAVLYTWGSHNQGASRTSRAVLVGGTTFAQEYAQALAEEREYLMNLSLAGGINFEFLHPLVRFRTRDGRTMTLVDQSENEIYFVVVSAYDYAALARGQKLVLWRTKMSVDAAGVSIDDALAGAITRASHYFGRDMPVAATVYKPVRGEARVDIGPLSVEEYLTPTPTPEPDKAPTPP